MIAEIQKVTSRKPRVMTVSASSDGYWNEHIKGADGRLTVVTEEESSCRAKKRFVKYRADPSHSESPQCRRNEKASLESCPMRLSP
jgi:hypothetical protein